MRKWEEILCGYLEGTDSRADAEALQMRIHLPVDDRAEVETMLRLADVVSLALGSTTIPKNAIPRLVDTIKNAPPPPVPASWRLDAGQFLSDTSVAESEDAVNQWLEGAGVDCGTVNAENEEQLDEVEAFKAQLSADEPPAGAVDRLLSRLHEAENEPDQQVDEDAGRILSRLKVVETSKLWQPFRRPDVLAASADVERTPDDENQDEQDNPLKS